MNNTITIIVAARPGLGAISTLLQIKANLEGLGLRCSVDENPIWPTSSVPNPCFLPPSMKSNTEVILRVEPLGKDGQGVIKIPKPSAEQDAGDGNRDAIIEECAAFIQKQERGTRYDWMPGSGFEAITVEIANRLRTMKKGKTDTNGGPQGRSSVDGFVRCIRCDWCDALIHPSNAVSVNVPQLNGVVEEERICKNCHDPRYPYEN